jgi:hypothetical protein
LTLSVPTKAKKIKSKVNKEEENKTREKKSKLPIENLQQTGPHHHFPNNMHAKARFYRNPEAILTDPNSFARLQSQRVSHFHLDLACDFERSILFGRAELKMDFIRSSK